MADEILNEDNNEQETGMVTLSEAKAYLRVDSSYEDIQSGEYCKHEILCMKEILRVGVFYTLGYLYEHREEADHHDLVMTLRNLLFSIREGVI